MRNRKFLDILTSSFNQCFFIALFMLSIYAQFMPNKINEYSIFVFPLINGIVTSFVTYLLNGILEKKKYLVIYSKKTEHYLIIIAFIAGVLAVLMAKFLLFTIFTTIFIIYITLKNIKCFNRRMVILLQVDKVADLQSLIEFFDFFINLILTFTVINLSIFVIGHNMGVVPGFNFDIGAGAVVDSLYFTVITMTSVGFGDIVAQSNLAKLVVVLETIISYIMFGLMIGVISRGVNFKK